MFLMKSTQMGVIMSINSSGQYSQTFQDSVYFDLSFGEAGKKVHEFELSRRLEPEPGDDPEKPPRQEPGDKYLFIGAFIGLVVGGVSGGIVSGFIGWLITNIIIGLVVGGVAGVWIGSLFKKRMLDKR